MDSIDIPDSLHGRRTLAAIVFSDIVNFSARVGQDEEHTLKLVRRDLGSMKKLCEKHQGQVLKTTGDGLLMFFNSAVHAVACAQEIQECFAEMEKKLSAKNVLKHRIGIHLGDVFVSKTDVMGDGVNVAARIQAEAPPGGICVSQTVYDVVKNRLAIKTTFLGPRELKNIKEAVPVYRILLAAQEGEAIATPPLSPQKEEKKSRSLPRWAKITVAVVAALILLNIVVKRRRHRNQPTPPDTPAVSVPAKTETPPPSPLPDKSFPQPAKVDPRRQRGKLLKKYDFDGLVAWVKNQDGLKDTELGEGMIQKYQKLASLFRWLEQDMDKYSRIKPLRVTPPGRLKGDAIEIWKEKNGRYAARRRGETTHLSLEEIKPPVMASVLKEAIAGSGITNRIQQGKLKGGLLLFAAEYKLLGPGGLHDPKAGSKRRRPGKDGIPRF